MIRQANEDALRYVKTGLTYCVNGAVYASKTVQPVVNYINESPKLRTAIAGIATVTLAATLAQDGGPELVLSAAKYTIAVGAVGAVCLTGLLAYMIL